jgi:hypothetical protein
VRAKLIGGADVQPVEVVGRALLQPLVNSGHLLVPCRKLRRHIRAIDEARRVWRGAQGGEATNHEETRASFRGCLRELGIRVT